MVFIYTIKIKEHEKINIRTGVVFGENYEDAVSGISEHYGDNWNISELDLKLIEEADNWLIECSNEKYHETDVDRIKFDYMNFKG